MGRPIPKSKHKIIVKNNNIVTLSFAIDSITIIKLVLNPVEPTAPTIIPAVAIAIPTPTIFKAPFSKPTMVWLNHTLRASVILTCLINRLIKFTKINETVA